MFPTLSVPLGRHPQFNHRPCWPADQVDCLPFHLPHSLVSNRANPQLLLFLQLEQTPLHKHRPYLPEDQVTCPPLDSTPIPSTSYCYILAPNSDKDSLLNQRSIPTIGMPGRPPAQRPPPFFQCPFTI